MPKKSFTANMPAEMFITPQAGELETAQAAPTPETDTTPESAAPVVKKWKPPKKKMGTAPKPPKGYMVNHDIVETKSKRVQLLMQPSLVAALKAGAKKSNLSFNAYVHILLEEALGGKD